MKLQGADHMTEQNKKNNCVEAIIPINKKRKKQINLLFQDAVKSLSKQA